MAAAVTFWLNNTAYRTLDLLGRSYVVDAEIKPVASGAGFAVGKRLTNGALFAKSTFTGSYIFDFTNFDFGSACLIDNLRFRGGPGNTGSYVVGHLKFDSISGLDIRNNHLQFGTGSLLLCTGTGAAGQTRIISNTIIGGLHNTGDTGVKGIEWHKGDCEILDNTVQTCSINVDLYAGAITVGRNHLWLNDAYNASHWNLYLRRARETLVSDNYIDQGRIKCDFDGNDGPHDFSIVDNKFTVKQPLSATWASNSTGFIVLAATNDTGNDAVLRNINITGNRFGAIADGNLSDFPAISIENNSKFSLNSQRNVCIFGNAYHENLTPKGTRVTKVQNFTSQSSVDVDVSNLMISGMVPNRCVSVVLQAPSGSGSIVRVSRSGSVFTVVLSATMTGAIILTADCNQDAYIIA